MPFVLLAPWFVDEFVAFLGALRAWFLGQDAPEVVAQASFLLIVGGLLMLSVVVGTAVLRSLLPLGTPVSGGIRDDVGRSMLKTPSLDVPATAVERGHALSKPTHEAIEAGRRLAAKWKPASLHETLEVVAKEGLAEPRLLRVFDDSYQVRHYGCPACASSTDGGAQGCGRAIGLYEEALRPSPERVATVREVACHRRGDPACEFEVRA